MQGIYDIVTDAQLKAQQICDFAECWFLLQGSMRLDAESGSFQLIPGDVVALPDGCRFLLQSDGCVVGRVVLQESTATVRKVRRYPAEECAVLRQIFLLAIQLQCSPMPNKTRVMSLMDRLVYELEYAVGIIQSRLESKIGPVLEEILEHFTDADFDLNAVIRATNYNPNYFNKLFREETGMAPRQFLIQQRIDYCKELMRHADANVVSIKRVALESGFTDPIYFARQFRQHEGITPTEYWRRVHSV